MKINTVTAFDPIARKDRTFFVVPMSTERALGIIIVYDAQRRLMLRALKKIADDAKHLIMQRGLNVPPVGSGGVTRPWQQRTDDDDHE